MVHHASSASAAFVALACVMSFAGCDASALPDGGMSDAAAADASERDASVDAHAQDASARCTGPSGLYAPARTTAGMLTHDGAERTFRVHVPGGYTGLSELPAVLMFHGGGGSATQFEERSSNMTPIADREGFVVVYPDGTGAVRTWNGGGCCGAAASSDTDDIGFVAALLDHLEAELCLDGRRIFAAGMSNGAMLSHRLACELPERFAAVAAVAGTDMSPTCTPSAPVAVMHVHGSDDGHVPFEGGEGCGPAGVAFTSVAATMERRRALNGCEASTTELFTEGDGACAGYDGCGADVVLCVIAGGGHSWPGGEPTAGLVECPANGEQSTTFLASEHIWDFFEGHPRP